MRHVLSAIVQNVPGVLAHISGMLASRAIMGAGCDMLLAVVSLPQAASMSATTLHNVR